MMLRKPGPPGDCGVGCELRARGTDGSARLRLWNYPASGQRQAVHQECVWKPGL